MRSAPEVIALLEEVGVAEISAAEADALLRAARVLREEDTRLAGPIRVFDLGGRVVVGESTTRGQPLARLLPSLEAAHRLVEDRLAVYERMWDGCGCRVDYLAVGREE